MTDGGQNVPGKPLFDSPGSKPPVWRRRWFWVLGVAMVLFIVFAAIGSSTKKPHAVKTASVARLPSSTTTTAVNSGETSSSTTSAPTTVLPTTTTTTTAPLHPMTTTTTAPPLPTPHIGQVGKDGDFAFTITSVECGLRHLGGTFGDTAPAGTQWCLVNMNVRDDKTTAQTFFASNQYAYDPAGRQLSATTGALIYLTHGATDALATINPGVSLTIQVPFQLSSSDSISKFVLHDSAFSGGVTIYNVG